VKIDAYQRPDGRIGLRNRVAVLPAVLCANEVAQRIAQGSAAAAVLRHGGGCTCGEDVARLESVLASLGAHPNVVGVVVVGLGCENCDSGAVAEEIARRTPWKPLEHLVIQQLGVAATIDRGRAAVKKMAAGIAAWQRSPVDLAGLGLAVECGGSDATSGLAANPALGLAVDRLVAAGGSVMFSETTEAIGAEHLLAERAPDENVARRLLETVEAARRRMVERLAPGEHFLTTGNMNGGLTTLEEKSLGCVCKTGSVPLAEVVEYGVAPEKKGLVMVDGTGFDVPSITGMVAAGAQIVAFTTGRGTPVGSPLAPVIKITGNPRTARRLAEIIDVDASGIVRAARGLDAVGEDILGEILAVASGKPSKAERFGFEDFSIATVAGAFSGV